MSEEVFWENVTEANGYKFQKNMVTHHARILDPNNVCITYGSIQEIIEEMDYVVNTILKI